MLKSLVNNNTNVQWMILSLIVTSSWILMKHQVDGLEEVVCGLMDMRNNPTAFIRNVPDEIVPLLQKCTVIEGDVHIMLITQGNWTDKDFARVRFPNLREITGHLMVFQVLYLTSLDVIFPELRVIRGETLLYNYGLVLFQNRDMQEIGLTKLTEITKGGVRIHTNDEMCYADTINWAEITKEPVIVNNNKPADMCADRCTPSHSKMYSDSAGEFSNSLPDGCAQRPGTDKNISACWNAQKCQKICPLECRQKNLSCSDVGDPICCHPECRGGCQGPGNHVCYACQNVYFNGTCVEQCPDGFFKYLGRRCVTKEDCLSKTTPEILMKSEGQHYKAITVNGVCDYNCPNGYQTDPEDEFQCTKCPDDIGCTKICPGHDPIHSIAEAQLMRGCNIINGFLDISIQSAVSKNVHELFEEYFGSLREVTKYVRISFTSSFVSLSFLKNLRIIRGVELWNNDYALSIFENQNLARLWTPNENRSQNLVIERGTVQVQNNPQLCYKTVMNVLDSVTVFQNTTSQDVSSYSNGHKAICEEVKLNLRVIYNMPSSLVLSWDVFNTSHIDFRSFLGYMLYYKPVDSEEVSINENRDVCFDSWKMQFIGPKERGFYVSTLKANQKYAFYVKTLMVNSPGMEGGVSDVIFEVTKFIPPSSVILRRIESVGPDSIFLQWDPPTSPNGDVTHYRIAYRPRVSEISPDRDYCVESIDYGTVVKELIPEEYNLTESSSSGTCPNSNQQCSECQIMNNGAENNPNFINNYQKAPINNNNVNSQQIYAEYLTELLENQPTIEREKSIFENAIHNKVFAPGSLRAQEMHRNNKLPPHLAIRMKREILPNYEENLQELETLENPDGSNETTTPINPTVSQVPRNSNSMTDFVGAQFLNTTSQNVTLTNLKHFTLYEIKIWACQNVKVPESSCSRMELTRYRRTLLIEDNDRINDASVHVESTVVKNKPTVRKLFWTPPEDPNGMVVSYDIELWRQGSEKPSVPQCVPVEKFNSSVGWPLSDLVAGNYSVRIQAVTLAQRGPWTTPVFFFVAAPFFLDGWLVLLIACLCSLAALTLGVLAVIGLYRRRFAQKCQEYVQGIVSCNPDYMSQIEVYTPDEWELSRDQVQLGEEIGRGSFGVVYEGYGQSLKSAKGVAFGPCAVKTVPKTASLMARWNFLSEATIMKRFHTAYIVKLLGVVSEGQPPLIVMELMSQGNLKDHLLARRPDSPYSNGLEPPTLREVRKMACEIADAMAYLEAIKFCHRDLACRNCMVAGDGTIKLGDFGMAREFLYKDYYRPFGRRIMPVRWMAPEALRDHIFTHKSDVWSYGVVLWEITTLARQPYSGMLNEEVFKFVVDDRRIMDQPAGCADQMYNIILQCWQYDPRQRPSFLYILDQLVDYAFDVDSQFWDISFYARKDLPPDTGSINSLGEDGDLSLDSMNSHLNDPLSQKGVANCDAPKNNVDAAAAARAGGSWTLFDKWFTCFDPKEHLEKQLQREEKRLQREERELLQTSREINRRQDEEQEAARKSAPPVSFLTREITDRPSTLLLNNKIANPSSLNNVAPSSRPPPILLNSTSEYDASWWRRPFSFMRNRMSYQSARKPLLTQSTPTSSGRTPADLVTSSKSDDDKNPFTSHC